MVGVVDTGTAADDGTGDPLRAAFDKLNQKCAELEAIAPTVISGTLNTLTLDNLTVPERSAEGTLVGNIGSKSATTTLRCTDPNENRFQINGTRLEVAAWELDPGVQTVSVEEVLTAGNGQVTRQSTVFTITVTANALIAQPTVTKYAALVSQGTGDGSSAANAMALATLLGGAIAPGAVVGLRADLGDVPISGVLTVTQSGTAGNPITIIGVDANGKRKKVRYVGSRWPYRKQTHDPEEVIPIYKNDTSTDGTNVWQFGAISYVTFEEMEFVDVAVCFNQAGGNPDHLTFRHINFQNIQRIYEHTSTSGHSNSLFEYINGNGFSKCLIRPRGTTTGCVIQHVYVDALRQDNDQWSTLFQADQTAQAPIVTDVRVRNCHNNEGTNYWNADGGSTEELNPGGVFTDMVSTGHTDAGIDLKTGATIIRGTFGDCKRNIKLWPGQSGNGKYHVDGAILLPPKKRGGSGGACHFNINNGPYPVELRCLNMDLRLFGQPNANEIAFLDTTVVAIIKYINVQRDAVPSIANQGAGVRFMIAAAAPTGAITLTANTANLSDGSAASIPIATNRDASFGGVIIRSIGGADAALFQITGVMGIGQSISPVSPIAYTGTAADAKSLTVTLEDIAGNTLGPVPFTVNIVADTTDYRVLDVTFTGTDNTQTATDASPAAHALSYGSAAKIRTTIDPAGRLFVPFTANANTTGCVRITADSADWDITGPWTLIASAVRMDTAATGLKQTIVGRHNNTSSSALFRLMFDTAGRPAFEMFTSAGLAFTLTDPTVRSAGVDYDLKVTRKLISGTTYQWDLYVNGVSVANVQNTTIPNDATGGIGIGATTAARDYMQGYPKRVAIHKGTANGT